MKALLISDIHTSYKVLSLIYDLITQQKINCIIFAGDVVDSGEPASFVEEFIWLIERTKSKLLWVPGNNDFGRAYHKLNAKYKSLEGQVVEFSGRKFTGVGGSPASWSGQYQGERSVDKKAIASTIFVSHVPPPSLANFQKFDQTNPKIQDTSNKQIQNYNNQNNNVIPSLLNNVPGEELQNQISGDNNRLKLSDAPLVHICGHIHHTWGVAKLGSTKVIKLAGGYLGYYAIIDLNTLMVRFERFWK